MPLETFIGDSLTVLMARAQSTLGDNAVVLDTRRSLDANGTLQFELLAGTPGSVVGTPDPKWRKLTALTPTPRPATRQGRPGHVVALVGPTGVGKTTTLAKLACHPRIFGTKDIGFLSFDTYRVGAVEQLKTYADIARVPLEVVYDEGELPAAFKRLADRDVVLIDTPGRSPRNQADFQAVQRCLAHLRPDETHLVVPAGVRPELARAALAMYAPLQPTHLLATKLDEWPEDRLLFDLAAEMALPMRWITDGQEVPADIRPADARLALAAARARSLAGAGSLV